jgi:hypothetical protein
VRPTLLAVDAHAHLHPAHRVDRWLTAALANLARLGAGAAVERAVVLADTPGAEGFRRLAEGPLPHGTRAEPVTGRGPGTAVLVSRGVERVLVIAARQLVTRERLEVLALGTRAVLAEGRSLDATLADVRTAGATAVLPWSPGKWLGARGRLVAATLERCAGEGVLVADSSLRPRGLPLPALLRRARRLGIGLVAGSDPLPPRGEERHAGRYGVIVRARGPVGELVDEPAAALAELVRGGELAGRRSSLPGALWRLARHRRGRGAASGRSAG